MTQAIRTTVRTATELTRWAAAAEPGQQATYHLGNLAADRAASPALHLLAETVLLLSEHGYIATQQHVLRLAAGTSIWYCATRTGRGNAPRSIMFGQCDAHQYRALQALRDRDSATSATRAIRDHMGCPEQLAMDYLTLLFVRGWVEECDGRGWQLTREGSRMLT